MEHSDVYKAMETLREYPAITEYIKSFKGDGGFMYTAETDPDRIALNAQLENILDEHGYHSGASWGCMMRDIQAVLNGVITVEQLKEEDRIRREKYQGFLQTRREERAAANEDTEE